MQAWTRRLALLASGSAILALAACDSPDAPADAPAPQATGDAGYVDPPHLVSAVWRADGMIQLAGQAAPNAQVRIASPGGQALVAKADAKGAWSLTRGNDAEPRVFGLSMTLPDKRVVQAQGYLLLVPGGPAMRLQSGAGAISFAAARAAPQILTVDYDAGGGAVVSGVAKPGALVSLRVDHASMGAAHADADGHFSVAVGGVSDSLAPGQHTLDVDGDTGQDQVTVEIVPPEGVMRAPVRAARIPVGWRVDWATPAGGVQTTLALDRRGGAS